MRPRGRKDIDPRDEQRAKAKELVQQGVPAAMAAAVAQGRLSLNEALEKLARRSEVDRLMRKHDLTRAVATQIVMGHADLDAFLQRRKLEAHVADNGQRSCLDEARASGRLLALQVVGQRRVTGVVTEVGPYEVTVRDEAGAEVKLHKLEIKCAWYADDYKKVRKALRRDKALTDSPKEIARRPQDRYGLSDKRLFRFHDEGTQVDATLVEGEVIRGAIMWFGRYEFAIGVKGESEIVVFRHALADLRSAR